MNSPTTTRPRPTAIPMAVIGDRSASVGGWVDPQFVRILTPALDTRQSAPMMMTAYLTSFPPWSPPAPATSACHTPLSPHGLPWYDSIRLPTQGSVNAAGGDPRQGEHHLDGRSGAVPVRGRAAPAPIGRRPAAPGRCSPAGPASG